MAVSVSTLTAANAERWDRAKIKAASKASFASVAKKLVAAKDRYQAIEDSTGVPWFVIAVIHQRESSQRWDRSIAQGDPWNKKSTHVPKGRGPFKSFEDAAVDALKNCAPYAARWKDWSPGGTMTLLEHYNGLGYANRGLPSPYIWSGTDQYVKGKYIADGKFSATAVDKQLGCAGLILAMQDLDTSVSFDGSDPVAIADLPDDDVASDSAAVAPEVEDSPQGPETMPVASKDNQHVAATAVKQTLLQRFWAKIVGVGAMAGAAVQGLSDQFNDVREYVRPFTSWFRDVPGWLWLVGVGLVAALIYFSAKKANESIDRAKQASGLN